MTATSTFERATTGRRRHRSATEHGQQKTRLGWRILGLTLVLAWVLGCCYGLVLLVG
jgi:hypothetical protein